MQAIMHSLFRRLNRLVDDFKILNWDSIQKCILVFILFILIKILWISWKFYIFQTPEVQLFVNLSQIRFQLHIEYIAIIVALMLIIGLLFTPKTHTTETITPYFTVNIFALTLLYDAYMAGIFSPNTMVNTACYLFIGIILFNMRVIFSVILTVGIAMAVISEQTIAGHLTYAPIFNFDTIGSPAYLNAFWLASIAYFIFPILILCILLLLLILKQWRARENYIAHLVQYDVLTGVFNRRELAKQLQALETEQHSANLNTVIMLDLDYFKTINDQHGHLVGDQVLKKVAEIIKSNIRSCDIVGRYGGEEFLIILKNINQDHVYLITQRLHRALSEYKHAINDSSTIQVTGSLGVAMMQPNQSSKEAVHAADVALYKAKASGRNQICFANFEPEIVNS